MDTLTDYLSIIRDAVRASSDGEEEDGSYPKPECVKSEKSVKSLPEPAGEPFPPASGITSAPAVPGLESALRWAHVYQGPVVASVAPADWDGAVPEDCGQPALCETLGPCASRGKTGVCPLIDPALIAPAR
jgi:hypothetical protein